MRMAIKSLVIVLNISCIALCIFYIRENGLEYTLYNPEYVLLISTFLANILFLFGFNGRSSDSLLGLWIEAKKQRLRNELAAAQSSSSTAKHSPNVSKGSPKTDVGPKEDLGARGAKAVLKSISLSIGFLIVSLIVSVIASVTVALPLLPTECHYPGGFPAPCGRRATRIAFSLWGAATAAFIPTFWFKGLTWPITLRIGAICFFASLLLQFVANNIAVLGLFSGSLSLLDYLNLRSAGFFGVILLSVWLSNRASRASVDKKIDGWNA